LKVVFVTTSFPRSESDVSGTFVHRLAEHLIDAGIDVEVIAPGDAEASGQDLVGRTPVRRVTYLLPRSWQRLAYGYGIPENIRRERWLALQAPFLLVALFWAVLRRARNSDVLHAHWTASGLVAVLAGMITRTPVIVTIWGTDVRRLPGSVNRWILHRAAAVIGLSREMQDRASALGVDAISIPAPVDTHRFHPGAGGDDAAGEIGVESGDRLVIFVGRLSDEKDPMTLLEAFPVILARVPTARLVLVGDGVLAGTLAGRAAELDISQRVHFLGARHDVERFYRLGDVFVSLSPIENVWSTTITEATFSGLPVVLTRAGHTEEVFTSGVDCLLVPPRDPEAAADAIVEILLDPLLGERLAAECLELHRRHGYDNEHIVASHIALYEAATSAGMGR
jgi:glycosyltransferase involved in cell wall biosynthesis